MSLIGPDPFPIAELGVIIAKETSTATKTLRFLDIRPLLGSTQHWSRRVRLPRRQHSSCFGEQFREAALDRFLRIKS